MSNHTFGLCSRNSLACVGLLSAIRAGSLCRAVRENLSLVSGAAFTPWQLLHPPPCNGCLLKDPTLLLLISRIPAESNTKFWIGMEIAIAEKVVISSWNFNQLSHNYSTSVVTRLFANTHMPAHSLIEQGHAGISLRCWQTDNVCRLKHSYSIVVLSPCVIIKGWEQGRSNPQVIQAYSCSDLECSFNASLQKQKEIPAIVLNWPLCVIWSI